MKVVEVRNYLARISVPLHSAKCNNLPSLLRGWPCPSQQGGLDIRGRDTHTQGVEGLGGFSAMPLSVERISSLSTKPTAQPHVRTT